MFGRAGEIAEIDLGMAFFTIVQMDDNERGFLVGKEGAAQDEIE